MIALLACLTFVAPARVVEFIQPQATEISIQALVTMPKLGAKDEAKLQILTRAIIKQTQTYPRREMLVVTNGEPVHCDITPDRLRFVVNVPAGKLKPGLSLMESLLRDATLNQENLDAAAQEIAVPDYWAAALNPVLMPNVALGSDEAQTLYHRVFRPDHILLAVGGRFAPGDVQTAWSARMDAWNVEKEPRGYFDISETKYREQNPGTVTTIDLAGVPILSGDAALSTKILSLFALGVGKGASLFRVVREKHAWSYRQDAILSPTKEGWLPRLLIACIPADDTKDRVKLIQSELLDDIKSWDEASRLRAIGMAEAVLTHHVPFSPFYVLGSSPVGDSLEDETYLAAYWPMKTGLPWDPAALLQSMRKVSLDELKDQATSMVSSAFPRVLPGS